MVTAPALIHQLSGMLLLSSPESITAFGEAAAGYIALVHAVLGAVMVGWGVTILLVLLGPFRRASREAWLILSISLTAWFIPDTGFSLWSGFWQNAAFNTVLAVLYAIPLAATRGSCLKRDV